MFALTMAATSRLNCIRKALHTVHGNERRYSSSLSVKMCNRASVSFVFIMSMRLQESFDLVKPD